MIFCGPAKRVTIRVDANDAASAPVCQALIAFLCPKDVCCLQVSFLEGAVEIQFLARQGKVDGLTEIASLIAPGAAIYIERATIVHAKTGAHIDSLHERAEWESSVRFQSAVALEKQSSPDFVDVQPSVNGTAITYGFGRSGRKQPS